MTKKQLSNIQCHADIKSCHAELVSASRNRFRNKFGMTLLLILFSILFFSCENAVDAAYDNYIEESQAAASSQKSFVVFNLVESNRIANRTISPNVTTQLFSDITFSGSRTDGVSITPITASSFAQLCGSSIEVEAGNWSFNLEAWLGKTATSPGGKYIATQTLNVGPGDNILVMTLSPAPEDTSDPDPGNQYLLADHPGSWKVELLFPYAKIDKIKLYLMPYSTYITGAVPSSSLLHQFVKGSDYTSGSINIAESSLQMGSYVIYIEYFTNLTQQNSTSVHEELLNTWAELLRISPGALSEGTITLPNADNVYSIRYELGEPTHTVSGGSSYSWVTSPTEAIPLSYTRNSGTSGVITLPTDLSLVAPDSFYNFEGWYTSKDKDPSDPNKYIYSGPVTTFNVTDAENKTFYAKWHEPVYDVYVKVGADDSVADGTKTHPFSSVTLATYQAFDNITGTNPDGSFKSTIHILSDYTGTNKITVPWGNNDTSLNGMCVNLVGEKNEVANADVELDVCVGSANSFIYLDHSQSMKVSHINITSSANHTNPNGFGCISVKGGSWLSFEDSTIKGYTGEGCSAINIEGVVHLKNCEISGNKAIDRDTSSSIWANAVNYGSGMLYLDGNVIIKGNKILKDDGSGNEESEAYNLYVGSYTGGSLTFMPILINGNSLTGSEIWVKLAQEPHVFTTGYGTQAGEPSDYFHSDSSYEVRLVSGEARIAAVVNLYVAPSPTGNDTSGSGTEASPYASIARAVQQITQANNTGLDATIYVTGDLPCNTTIVDGTSGGTQLIANSLKIEGIGTDSALNGNANGTVLDSRTTVPLTLKNLTIKNGQTTSRGGGLYIDGTTVEINNCIIENNSAYFQGGGVYLTNGAQLTMNGQSSVIRANWLTGALPVSTTVSTNKCGGGVYIDSGTTFTMNAGTIEGNGAYSGGGVYVRGSFEMNGNTDTTVIQSNMRIAMSNTPSSAILSSTQLTANVEVGIPGTFTMNGGKITSSLTRGQNGAGVCLYASHGNGDENGTATFNMNDGEISGLNISESGAVYLLAHPSNGDNFNMVFNMSGGKITGNTAIVDTYSEYGTCAGVYVGRYGAFNMTGGEISHNHARINAGGVYCENITGTGLIVPTITLGQTSSASTILIKDNTVGSPAVTGNIYLDEGKTVTVAGALSTASEVGITRAGAFSASPFTSGFGSTNSGTAPADIFTSDEGYTIIAGSGGEAAFLTSSASGTVYAPGDYHFTLAASRSSVTVGRAATVTITPDITRTEPNGNSTPLFYNPSDRKLYLDSAFTQPEGSNAEVTWSASLWCGTEVEYPELDAVDTTANANKFTIPALSFENTYTLNVTATYQGYTHNANLPLQCQAGGAIPSDFVLIPNGSFKRAASADAVTAGEVYTVTISYDFYMCEHEVTQKEWEDVMGCNQNDLLITSTVGSPSLKGTGDDYPVYYVNWYAAIVYCNMRSLAEGLDCVYTVGSMDFATYDTTSILRKNYSLGNSITADFSKNGYRLPTEAEWEYAALGDYKDNPNWNGYGDSSNTSVNVFAGYNGSNTVGSYAYGNNGLNHEIKGKLPNSYGLYDMCDNVEEWCWDWYNANQYSIDGNTTDPVGTVYDSEQSRVVRGFSWNSQTTQRSVAARHKTSPGISSDKYGLRLVRSAE